MNNSRTTNQLALQRSRDRLVDELRAEGVASDAVLQAMRNVPRHLFVEDALQYRAYEDAALPIGQSQTISQPLVVAIMTQTLFSSTRMHSVLEIGTGCGYQTAVLAEMAKRVCTVERIRSLQEPSEQRLRELGYRNIEYKHGDGFVGWRERGPFDGIMVTAAASEVPKMLVDQLAIGGRMVLPLGSEGEKQQLLLLRKTGNGLVEENLLPVRFVPLLRGVEA